MSEQEEFYDREIAPALLELARRCEGMNMSFLAMIEWKPGETARTMSIRAGSGIGLKMVHWAMESDGNADKLIGAMKRHGQENGHNSAFLHLLERRT